MDVFTSIFKCFGFNTDAHQAVFLPVDDEKTGSTASIDEPHPPVDLAVKQQAQIFQHTLLHAHALDLTLRTTLEAQFYNPPNDNHFTSTASWYEALAAAILNGLETAIRFGEDMSTAVRDQVEHSRALAEAEGFVADHPVFCTVVAIGVLVAVAPWVLEVLGFGEVGIVEGSWAAWWQSRYAGFVPKGSLFSFLQRCGMTW